MGWKTNKNGDHYNTDKKVRDISDDGDDVNVTVNVDNIDELEEFAKEKAEMVNESEDVSDFINTVKNKKIGYLDDGYDQGNVHLDISLKQKDETVMGVDGQLYKNPLVLSISGDVGNTAGQIHDQLKKQLSAGNLKLDDDIDKDDFRKFLDIWDKWHLNDMNAGTIKQMELVNDHIDDDKYKNEKDWYDKAVAILEDNNLLEDDGYRFGSKWLYNPLPKDVIVFVSDFQNKL